MRGIDANGAFIRETRRQKGLTQDALAAVSCCDVKTIRKAEQGARLDLATLVRIADALTVQLPAVARSTDADSLQEHNKEIVRRWYRAFDSCNVAETLAFYHDDAVLEVVGSDGLPGGGRCEGLDGIRRHCEEAFASFDVPTMAPDEYQLFATEDFVFMRFWASARVISTGREFESSGVHEFRVRDGKFVSHMIYCDTTAIRHCVQNAPDPGAQRRRSDAAC